MRWCKHLMGDKIVYRLADFEDETDILAVLEEVAPEIPVELDGPERQEKSRPQS